MRQSEDRQRQTLRLVVDGATEVTWDPAQDQRGAVGIGQRALVEPSEERGKTLQRLEITARLGGRTLARLVEPFHGVRSRRVRTLDQQVDLARQPDLFAHRLGLDERGVVRGDQLRGIGLDLDRGKGGPTGQADDEECDDYGRRQPSDARDPTARCRPEAAAHERLRNAAAEQQQQWQADQVVREVGHRDTQRHEETELPHERDPGGDERQHPGGGGGRSQPGGGEDAASRHCQALLQCPIGLHHPVHRLDQVVGGQPEDDRKDDQRRRCDREAEESGDAGGPQCAECGDQDGEHHRGAQRKESDHEDGEQRQRHQEGERAEDGIGDRERERR